ncbi:MAG: hypothetical protein D3924_04235 [Candidatus Electrothrix sp. AR4]|nr:hypothetical protein [Candidatus Electrothrix sp. AR4]
MHTLLVIDFQFLDLGQGNVKDVCFLHKVDQIVGRQAGQRYILKKMEIDEARCFLEESTYCL